MLARHHPIEFGRSWLILPSRGFEDFCWEPIAADVLVVSYLAVELSVLEIEVGCEDR